MAYIDLKKKEKKEKENWLHEYSVAVLMSWHRLPEQQLHNTQHFLHFGAEADNG